MSFKHYALVVIVCIMSVRCAWAQTNPYTYGTPNYWMAQGLLDTYSGKFDIAYEDLQKAQNQYQRLGDVPSQIQALMAMGALKAGLGEWDKADIYYKGALYKATESKDDAIQSIIMADLLSLYWKNGDIVGYNHYQKALDSLYHISTSDKTKAVYYLYWSNEFLTRREFTMAENQLRQCWDAIQNLPFADREQAKLNYYNVMLKLKQQQKQHKEAIRYAKDYIRQTKFINGRESDQQYQAYGNLCTLYALNNDSIQAFACLDSLEHGVGHSYQDKELIANFYNIKGCCYANFRKYGKAIEYFEKAYTTLGHKDTGSSPSKLSSVMNKAEAYFMLKRYDDAFTAYSEFVNVSKNKYGETSNAYYQALLTLANIEGARGKIHEADSLFRFSMSRLLQNMKQLWRYATPTQREQFWMEMQNTLSGMAAFAIKCGNDNSELTETCYNALLFAKALLLETEKSVVEIIRNEGNEDDIARYRNLLSINNRLLTLKNNYEYNKHEIDSLTIRQRELERQLSNTCQSYNKYNKYLDINYTKVRDCLKDNEILIDFSSHQTEDSIRQYVAYIFDKNSKYPILKKCFEQQQVDSLLNGMQNFTLYNYKQLHDMAINLIWKPIEANIPKSSTVYYVPSGIMHSIALEALPLSNEKTLGQEYKFVRLTSARELLRERSAENNKTAVLYGGLQYDVSPEKMAEESKRYTPSDLAWVMRSEYGNKGFEDLRNTKNEIERIERTLTSSGYTVTPYMGTKGNAESFVALSGKAPSIVHIATHGFYYTPEEAKDKDYLSGYTDAMSLSGLVFAGGNAAWLRGKEANGVLGGILTARDIANLDLKGVDMIVLSACKTAQGKVTSDGIFGLQRAFKKAGVGTIVMSLWNVSDKTTSEFMGTFYERLTDHANAWDKRKAFEEAKEIIRKKHPDPFHWAAFVMLD